LQKTEPLHSWRAGPNIRNNCTTPAATALGQYKYDDAPGSCITVFGLRPAAIIFFKLDVNKALYVKRVENKEEKRDYII